MSRNWAQVSADHRDEFASMGRCAKGSFNVLLDAPYLPPEEDRYREMARERGKSVGRYEDGNYISPRARVVGINGKAMVAWIYRGGAPGRPRGRVAVKKGVSAASRS